jgi:hypothetical protein
MVQRVHGRAAFNANCSSRLTRQREKRSNQLTKGFARGLCDIVYRTRWEAILLGYACVSKADDQDPAAQVAALRAAACERVYEERASGAKWDRPELHRLLDHLRLGDVLMVCRPHLVRDIPATKIVAGMSFS